MLELINFKLLLVLFNYKSMLCLMFIVNKNENKTHSCSLYELQSFVFCKDHFDFWLLKLWINFEFSNRIIHIKTTVALNCYHYKFTKLFCLLKKNLIFHIKKLLKWFFHVTGQWEHKIECKMMWIVFVYKLLSF